MSTLSASALKHLNEFYSVFRKLSTVSKIAALAGMVSVYGIINPQLEKPIIKYIDYNQVLKDGNSGNLKYWQSSLIYPDEYDVADHYANSPKDVQAEDWVVQISFLNYDEKMTLYDYRFMDKKRYGLKEYEKDAYAELTKNKRKKLYLSFVLTMGIALAGYKGVLLKLNDALQPYLKGIFKH